MKKKQWLKNYKIKYKCEKCGYNKYVGALSFHHENPNEKFTSISNMITLGFGKNKILKEISKCQILCLNCHAEIHNGEQQDRKDIKINLIDKIIICIYFLIKRYLKIRELSRF